MINQALVEVVKNQLSAGVSEADVREFLRRRGTDEAEIREMFDTVVLAMPDLDRVMSVEIPAPVAEPELTPTPIEPILGKVSPVPVVEPVVSIESAPAETEAHGVVREVPPLQPTVPFAGATGAFPALTVAPISQSVSPNIDRKRRVFAFVMGAIGIVALFVGGRFVYSIYFGSPESQLDRMMANIRGVRSFAFSGQTDMRVSEFSVPFFSANSTDPLIRALAILEPVTFTTTISGAYDIHDESVPKLVATMLASSDKWALGDFSLGLAYRGIGQADYFSFSDLPDLGFLHLDFLRDKWFATGDSGIREQMGLPVGGFRLAVPVFAQAWRNASFSAWREYRFFAVVDSLGSESVDGVSAWHYSLAFDPDAFASWAVLVGSIANGSLTDAEANELRATAHRWSFDDIQLWIGKRDGLPRKIAIRANVTTIGEPAKHTGVDATFTVSRFNDNMDISVPEGATSIDEALQGLFGQLIGTTVAPKTALERNARRVADIESIASAIQKNMTDNSGVFSCVAGALPARVTILGSRGYAIESCLAPRYLRALPRDPNRGTATISGYSVSYDQKTNKLIVSVPYAELN